MSAQGYEATKRVWTGLEWAGVVAIVCKLRPRPDGTLQHGAFDQVKLFWAAGAIHGSIQAMPGETFDC